MIKYAGNIYFGITKRLLSKLPKRSYRGYFWPHRVCHALAERESDNNNGK